MTTTVLFLIGVTCSLVAFYYQRKVRLIDDLPRSVVLVNEIPGIGDSLRKSGQKGSFAAFLCASADESGPDDFIEAQLSIENGQLGFDWVLLAPRNIQERKRVEEFAGTRGIITEIVGIEHSSEIVMIHRGFDRPDGS